MMMVIDMVVEKKFRSDEEKKKLKRRLNIIAGQVNGISQMIDDDRYCKDILIQISSTSSALKSFGNELLKNHMNSCMVDKIIKGDTEVVDEVVDLFSKLSK